MSAEAVENLKLLIATPPLQLLLNDARGCWDSLRQASDPTGLGKWMLTGYLCRVVGHMAHFIRKQNVSIAVLSVKYVSSATPQKAPLPSGKTFLGEI